jgi:hypothetical protein
MGRLPLEVLLQQLGAVVVAETIQEVWTAVLVVVVVTSLLKVLEPKIKVSMVETVEIRVVVVVVVLAKLASGHYSNMVETRQTLGLEGSPQ